MWNSERTYAPAPQPSFASPTPSLALPQFPPAPAPEPVRESLFGSGISLHGEIEGAQDLVIEGCFDGAIRMPGHRLTVGPEAVVKADVVAREILVMGRLSGVLQALNRIELRAAAVVEGRLSAARLVVEEGALVGGEIDILHSESLFPDLELIEEELCPECGESAEEEAFSFRPVA